MSAKTVIFMNEKIRHKNPSGPVIRAVNGRKVLESNLLLLQVDGKTVGRVIFDPENSPIESHEVKAWLEFEGQVVSG